MKKWMISSVTALALACTGMAHAAEGGQVGKAASDSSDSATTNWKGVALAGGAIAIAAVALVLVAHHGGHHHHHSH